MNDIAQQERAQRAQILDLMEWSAPVLTTDVVMIKGQEDCIHADFHDWH